MGRHQLNGTDTTEFAAVSGPNPAAANDAGPDMAVQDDTGAVSAGSHTMPQWGVDTDEVGQRRSFSSVFRWPGRVRLAAIAAAVCAVCVAVLGMAGWALHRADPVVIRSTEPDRPLDPDGSSVVPATPETNSTSSPGATPHPTVSASHLPTATPSAGATATPGSTTAAPTTTAADSGPAPARLAVNTTRSLWSVSQPDRYVVQDSDLANVATVTTGSSAATKNAATFTVVAGLADASCFSFTAGSRYLRHKDFRLRLDTNDSTSLFLNDATFCARTGSASGSVSFEAKNYPNYYIHQHSNGELWLDQSQDTAAFRADSSFYSVTPWA